MVKKIFLAASLLFASINVALAQGTPLFQVNVKAPSGQTVTAKLYPGNSRYGFEHIEGRHITGEIPNPNGITSFWPAGYEVRPGVSTPALMTEGQIVDVIEDTVVYGSKTSQGSRFVADYDPNAFGIDNVKAVVAVDDGSIITAYPTSGPSVCVYSDKVQQVMGGDCR